MKSTTKWYSRQISEKSTTTPVPAPTLGGREEAEKQGIASGIALGSPCFSGDFNLQGFSESTTKLYQEYSIAKIHLQQRMKR
jgi:hypothetical protein